MTDSTLSRIARKMAERLIDEVCDGDSLAEIGRKSAETVREAMDAALDKAERSMGYPGDVTAIKKIRKELRDGE